MDQVWSGPSIILSSAFHNHIEAKVHVEAYAYKMTLSSNVDCIVGYLVIHDCIWLGWIGEKFQTMQVHSQEQNPGTWDAPKLSEALKEDKWAQSGWMWSHCWESTITQFSLAIIGSVLTFPLHCSLQYSAI